MTPNLLSANAELLFPQYFSFTGGRKNYSLALPSYAHLFPESDKFKIHHLNTAEKMMSHTILSHHPDLGKTWKLLKTICQPHLIQLQANCYYPLSLVALLTDVAGCSSQCATVALGKEHQTPAELGLCVSAETEMNMISKKCKLTKSLPCKSMQFKYFAITFSKLQKSLFNV